VKTYGNLKRVPMFMLNEDIHQFFFPAEKRPSANNNNKDFNPKYLG
jgi:hypothetical protein